MLKLVLPKNHPPETEGIFAFQLKMISSSLNLPGKTLNEIDKYSSNNKHYTYWEKFRFFLNIEQKLRNFLIHLNCYTFAVTISTTGTSTKSTWSLAVRPSTTPGRRPSRTKWRRRPTTSRRTSLTSSHPTRAAGTSSSSGTLWRSRIRRSLLR